jgi:hypothetical protein
VSWHPPRRRAPEGVRDVARRFDNHEASQRAVSADKTKTNKRAVPIQKPVG